MRILVAVCLILLISSVRGFAESYPRSLRDPGTGHYHAAPYLAAATQFQEMGRTSACQIMLRMARSQGQGQQVIVLCRMLFTKRGISDFRRPMLGGAVFLAGTGYSDWPLEPIELVDGVPFLITRGYDLAGVAEPSEEYLRYCMANCDWNSDRYHRATHKQLRAALTKLLGSTKWKHPLTADDRKYLSSQI